MYSASKHAIEGPSESLDHELRQFNVHVTLVESAYAKTSLEANSPVAQATLSAYDRERAAIVVAVARAINNAPSPDNVARTIFDAALGKWHMRKTPSGQASLLRSLRRLLPGVVVDASLRTQFGHT